MSVLWVVIPVFNEPGTLGAIVKRVQSTPLPSGWTRKVIIVDDCSAPAGQAAVDSVISSAGDDTNKPILLRHSVNRGKGAALRTGFQYLLDHAMDSDAVIIQDADLEYDPDDFSGLLQPIIEGWADVVFGTRWGDHRPLNSLMSRIHAAGNRGLTIFSNALTGLSVLDMECCYKLLTLPALRAILPSLSEDRFGIEPQLAAAAARSGFSVAQRQIHYEPRGFSQGKKIGVRDGLRALYVIVREAISG